jgi:hypothetical protein
VNNLYAGSTQQSKKKQNKSQDNLQKYMTRIQAGETHRDSGFKELWIRCYKRYRNYVDQLVDDKGKPITGRSNISIPYSFTQVETILPRLVETLFAARPYVTVFGREAEDEFNAENMETLLDWQMNECFDIQRVFKTGLKELCMYGTAVTYTVWKLKERKVIKKQLQPVVDDESGESLMDEMQQPIQDWQPVETNEKEYDDPIVKFVDLMSFFVDPNADNIDDARYAGHVSYECKDYIQEMADQGLWEVDWKYIRNDYKHNQARADRMGAVGLPNSDEDPDHSDENGIYEIHHYWEDDKYVAIINRSWVAAETENPYWHKKKPYNKEVYCEVPHEFYGMGIIEMIEDLQDELNNERNMRIDFRSFLLRRMFKVRRGANIDRKQLVFKQGGIIEVDEMDDLDEMGVSDVPSSTFTEEQTIKQDMQDTSGAHDVVMGTSSSSETATSTMSKDNNASMRFKLVISSVEKSLLVGVSRLMMQLNQQFMDTDKVMRVTGEKGKTWVRLSPEDIQGEFDLTAAGSSVEPQANKEAFKQRMVELFGIVSNNPIMQQHPDKIMALLGKVFEAFDMKNTDMLLPTEQDMQGTMAQQAVQQFIAGLPPELQQVLAQFMQPSAPMMQDGSATPPGASSSGGANTAMMQEQGLQMTGG